MNKENMNTAAIRSKNFKNVKKSQKKISNSLNACEFVLMLPEMPEDSSQCLRIF